MPQKCGKIFVCRKIATKEKHMKKEHTLRTLLGLTQEDCAMLLGVTRSQWSMFELGQRDLPLAAKQLLTELLTHLQSPETKANRHPAEAQQEVAKIAVLERMLRENEYERLRLAKKINAITKKYEATIQQLKLVDYMAQRTTSKGSYEMLHLNSLARSAAKTIDTDGAGVLLQLQIKQEGLELEQLLLESKWRKLSSNVENTGGHV